MTKIEVNPLEVPSFNLALLSTSHHLQMHLASAKQAHLPTLATNQLQSSIQTVLSNAMSSVAQNAYTAAVAQVSGKLDIAARLAMLKDVRTQASIASTQIATVTTVALSAAMSKMRVASKDRAKFAVSHQLRSAFYLGTTRGWELNKKSKKLWIMSSVHDRDDLCDDNEEAGAISVFDFFPSGVMYCPGHIGCLCTLALVL